MRAVNIWCALCLVAICCVASSNARAERWLCDMPIGGKTYKQEWIISGDRMWAPKGKAFIHVLKNDENILVASHTDWHGPEINAHYTTVYLVIENHAGTLVELNDVVAGAVADLGPIARERVTPMIDVGHCVVDPRPTPPPPTMPPLASVGSTTGPTVSPTPQPSTVAPPVSLSPDEQPPPAPRGAMLPKPKSPGANAGEAEAAQKANLWKPQMNDYRNCNTKAARGIASQQGDPLSLATAARGLCSETEAKLRKAMNDAYANDLEIAEFAIERARRTVLEHNAADIVAVRAAKENAPPPPKTPLTHDY